VRVWGRKRGFRGGLGSRGPPPPVKSLGELRMFNLQRQSWNAIKYGQGNLDNSDDMDLEEDRTRYEADRAKDIRLAGTQGIDAAMKANQLDALLFPGGSGANIAPRPGYPPAMLPFPLLPTP